MIKRAIQTALATVVATASLAVLPSTGAHAQARQWKYFRVPDSVPLKVLGTACAPAEWNTVGRTQWNTGMICNFYNSGGTTKYHWTLWKYDPASHDSCFSDGWANIKSQVVNRLYNPALCHQPSTGRIPFSQYVAG